MSTAPPPPLAARPSWTVVRTHGPAEPFHQVDPGPDPGHQLWIRRLPTPALVLGSTQPEELVLAERARADGIEVSHRRSGGGLVYIDPATDCWIDAVVPVGSALWSDDVGRAFHWLGQAWARVIEASTPGGPSPVVHRSRPGPGSAARPIWCFGGVGSGEVTLAGSKVVGLSQRRTRDWARIQSLVLGAWPGASLLDYLDVDVARRIGARNTSVAIGPDPEPRSDRPPPSIDPALVRAGPPSGRRLPEPSQLANRLEALLTSTTP